MARSREHIFGPFLDMLTLHLPFDTTDNFAFLILQGSHSKHIFILRLNKVSSLFESVGHVLFTIDAFLVVQVILS